MNAVYPRWRGELPAKLSSGRHAFGLSPLARGTLVPGYRNLPKLRFIPAGAGNSGLLINACRSQAVYPRWRGELTDDVKDPLLTTGLSPLARGTHC